MDQVPPFEACPSSKPSFEETATLETFQVGSVQDSMAWLRNTKPPRTANDLSGKYGSEEMIDIPSCMRLWTKEEDELLLKLVENGVKNWSHVVEILHERTAHDCRYRWNTKFNPKPKIGPWTDEEERIFDQAHMKFGSKWSEIAKIFPGRTAESLKIHCYMKYRRKLMLERKRKRGSAQMNNN